MTIYKKPNFKLCPKKTITVAKIKKLTADSFHISSNKTLALKRIGHEYPAV